MGEEMACAGCPCMQKKPTPFVCASHSHCLQHATQQILAEHLLCARCMLSLELHLLFPLPLSTYTLPLTPELFPPLANPYSPFRTVL